MRDSDITLDCVSYPDEGNQVCFEIEDNSFWFRHRNRCIIATLNRLPPDGLFYDIGGGNGYVSLAIQNAGWPVALIEPGASGVANARYRGLERVIWSTFEAAGLSERSVPAAGAFDVVEHIRDDVGFVRSIAHSLKRGGRFYVTVPAFNPLWSQADKDAGHYRRYTKGALRKLLEQSGLQVEYLTYLFRFLPVPILVLRTLPWRLGIHGNRIRSHHSAGGKLSQAILDGVLGRELAVIRAGGTLAFGGSCLAVAKKA